MRRLILFAALLSLGAVCQPATRSARLGISGVWPPGAVLVDGAPQAGPQAWVSYWTFIGGASEYVVVHGTPGNVGAAIAQVNAASGKPAIVVTDAPESDDLTGYKAAVVAALSGNILAWCVGNEIESRTDLPALSLRIDQLAAAIKATKPSVQTCVVFQYERARGLPDAATRAALFRVDAIAFTSYPSALSGYTTAAAVPSSHYASMLPIAGPKAVLVTEVGWPTGPDQSAFIARLPALLPSKLTSVAWFSAYDYGSAAPVPFGSMGIAGRPAEAEWRKLLAVPRVP